MSKTHMEEDIKITHADMQYAVDIAPLASTDQQYLIAKNHALRRERSLSVDIIQDGINAMWDVR